MKTSKKQKKEAPPTPELPDELILEILPQLPVKSLLGFKCASKVRRATISDPSLVRSHLNISGSRWERNPSLLVTPQQWHSPSTFSGNIGFYWWQQGASKALLVHAWDFTGEFRSVHYFCHCDGLVLAATDTKVYLFNPATKDVVTLPDSSRNKVPGYTERPIGFGRDPRTGMYKVVRFFFLGSRGYKTGIVDMGVELCTVGGPAPPRWRGITVNRSYDPVWWETSHSVNGGVYWIVKDAHLQGYPRGILRFGLDDEAFNVTHLPAGLLDHGYDDGDEERYEPFKLSVLHGELCVTRYRVKEPNDMQRMVVVWALMEEDGATFMWEPRYTLHMMYPTHPVAFLPGTLILWLNLTLHRYDMRSNELTTMCDDLGKLRYQPDKLEPALKNRNSFSVIPYIESLVPISVHPTLLS